MPESRIKKIDCILSSRIGGFQQQIQPKIVIDCREFKSQLPSTLFHEGFQIIPVFLDSGDYILSDDMAVERKCVETGDLMESFRSKRLEKQLKTMCKRFKEVFLLIEYSENIKFSLESVNQYKKSFFIQQSQQNGYQQLQKMLKNEEQQKAYQLSLTYVLPYISAKFPKVKLIWSQGPEFSAKIFKKLKQNQKQISVEKFLALQKQFNNLDKKYNEDNFKIDDYFTQVNEQQSINQDLVDAFLQNRDEELL